LFQIGLPEIILIALVALVLVNPKELPGMMRRLGRMLARLRSMKEIFLKEIRDVDEEIGGSAGSGKKTHGRSRGKRAKDRA
jgi:sec-independent protein translocase protein TatB